MGADLDSAQVWMPGEARRVVHSGKGDIGGREFLRQHRFIGSAEHGLDAAVGSRAAPDPLHVGRKRGIRSKRAIAQNLFREHPPFAVALDRDENVGAVLSLKHAIRCDRGMREAHAFRRHAGFRMHERNCHPVRHRVEQGNRDRRALAAALARNQRFEDRLVSVHAGGDVADRYADAGRRVWRTGDRGQAGFRLHQHVVGLARGVRPVLAVAGDRANDEAGMLAAQCIKRKSQFRDGARLEVLYENVGAREHRREEGLAVGLREIEDERFLAAVEPDEIRALTVCHLVVVAREVALLPLDLDDAGAGIGEPAGAQRRRHRLLYCDDQEA